MGEACHLLNKYMLLLAWPGGVWPPEKNIYIIKKKNPDTLNVNFN